MSKRKHLGSIYTTYPAKIVAEYLGSKLTKLLFSIAACAIWTAVYYIGVSVASTLNNLLLVPKVPSSAAVWFRTEPSLWGLVGCYILLTFMIFRSRIGTKR